MAVVLQGEQGVPTLAHFDELQRQGDATAENEETAVASRMAGTTDLEGLPEDPNQACVVSVVVVAFSVRSLLGEVAIHCLIWYLILLSSA